MFQSDPIDKINIKIHEAIKNDDAIELKQLLLRASSENITGNHDNYNYLLLIASIHGSFDSIKCLLLSSDLSKHADINTRNDQVFNNSCGIGRLDIVKFILETKDLNRIINKRTTIKNGLLEASTHNQLEIFKYFAHEYQIGLNIKLTTHYEKCLITAYERENYPRIEDEIMSYIVFNLSIPKSKKISDYIEKNNAVELNDLFEKREFNESLHSELKPNQLNKKKVKV